MNLLGKILVVLVALASIMFLGVSIAVFTTHKDWETTVKDQQTEIQELNAEKEKLSDAYKRYVSNLQLEIDSAEQQVLKLENERAALATRNQEVQAELDRLKQARRDLTAEVASVQDANKRIAEENQQLEQNIESNQQAINQAFDSTVAATSDLHEAKVKLEIELERNAQLVEQVGGNQ